MCHEAKYVGRVDSKSSSPLTSPSMETKEDEPRSQVLCQIGSCRYSSSSLSQLSVYIYFSLKDENLTKFTVSL